MSRKRVLTSVAGVIIITKDRLGSCYTRVIRDPHLEARDAVGHSQPLHIEGQWQQRPKRAGQAGSQTFPE